MISAREASAPSPAAADQLGRHVGGSEEARRRWRRRPAPDRLAPRRPATRRGRDRPTTGGTPRPTTSRRRCAAGGCRRPPPARWRSERAGQPPTCPGGRACDRRAAMSPPTRTPRRRRHPPAPPTPCRGHQRGAPGRRATCRPACPAGESREAWRVRNPMASASSADQSPLARSNSPVAPALVNSAVISPVRWYASNSGSITRCRARPSDARS